MDKRIMTVKRIFLAIAIAALLVSNANAGWRFSRHASCSGSSCSANSATCTNGSCSTSATVYQAPVVQPVQQQAYPAPVSAAFVVHQAVTPTFYPVVTGCINGRCSR